MTDQRSLPEIVQDIVRERSQAEELRIAGLGEEMANAELKRLSELDWNRYEGRVPFSLVRADALNPYSGSTIERPSFVDPLKGRV